MRVAVRVDASRAIGTGHVRRCMALARALRACGADLLFLWRDLGIDVAAMLGTDWASLTMRAPQTGFTSGGNDAPHAAWAEIGQREDAAESIDALRDFAPDWVIVDHYGFDANWQEAVASGLGARIAVIDDLADRALSAELIIDHNHHADHRSKYAGVAGAAAAILSGPRFALLGPAFSNAARLVVQEAVSSIGLFMGGVDGDGASLAVLDAIDAAGFDGPVEVVTTSANPGLAALTQRVAARDLTALSVDLPDLSAFFARHQLQIGAGGGATWERCCIGAPTILVTIAENQQAVVPALADAGVVVAADLVENLLAVAIATLIGDAALRRHMAERARGLVDGRGAMRVAVRMLRDTLTVRPATIADAAMMLDWRNDPATRAVSRDSAVIDLAAHIAWTERVIADPARHLLIGQIGAVPVGVIRFDALDNGACEVSLYLDPGLHGLGLGPLLLEAGEAAAFPDRAIHAEVLPGNVASERLFLGSGYQAIGPGQFIKRRTAAQELST